MSLSALFSRAAPLPEAPASRMPPPEQALIFATIGALLAGLFLLQRRAPGAPSGHWLPRDEATGKRAYEAWVLAYSVVWMGSFGLIIALQLYEAFDATAYFVVCGGLALPLWVQARASAPAASAAPAARLHPLHPSHPLRTSTPAHQHTSTSVRLAGAGVARGCSGRRPRDACAARASVGGGVRLHRQLLVHALLLLGP